MKIEIVFGFGYATPGFVSYYKWKAYEGRQSGIGLRLGGFYVYIGTGDPDAY